MINTMAFPRTQKLVFSFGSNSTAQLRARVENPELKAFPAQLCGWKRIFCGSSKLWGGSGASLSRSADCITYGAAVYLSDTEISLLDQYEVGYEKECVEIKLFKSGCWETHTAICYIALDTTCEVMPSEAYLTAIHLNLREQFATLHPEILDKIEICKVKSHCVNADEAVDIKRIATWVHPGLLQLSLPALCVEVNARRGSGSKWVMPKQIRTIMEEFGTLSIHTTEQLMAWLHSHGITCDMAAKKDYSLLSTLECISQFSVLDAEALSLFAEILL